MYCVSLARLFKGFGTKLYQRRNHADIEVILGEQLDKYTAPAKFMEQALEWEIMDYTFYPNYWANRQKWQAMYISESIDPIFRSFLQAGMAKVVVTVKTRF